MCVDVCTHLGRGSLVRALVLCVAGGGRGKQIAYSCVVVRGRGTC